MTFVVFITQMKPNLLLLINNLIIFILWNSKLNEIKFNIAILIVNYFIIYLQTEHQIEIWFILPQWWVFSKRFQFSRGLKCSIFISTNDCVPFESVSTGDHENQQCQQRAKVCLMRTLIISDIETHTLAKHVDRLCFLS